jgi:hypothetical protein
MGDREGHRKISAHGVTDQIDALNPDAPDQVQNPIGGGAAILEGCGSRSDSSTRIQDGQE